MERKTKESENKIVFKKSIFSSLLWTDKAVDILRLRDKDLQKWFFKNEGDHIVVSYKLGM